MRSASACVVVLAALAVAGCQTEPGAGSPTGSVELAAGAVSECGGFAIAGSPSWDAGDYCDAERLGFSFDAEAGSLEIRNERVLANCCGERSIAAEAVDGVLVLTETDAPEPGGGRCWCMCVYDFAVTVSGVSGASLPARLVRDVTDGDGPTVIWEGALDLAAGTGSVVTSDEDAAGFCEPR